MKQWRFRQREDGKAFPLDLFDNSDFSPRILELLWQRGISTSSELENFLEPRLSLLPHPESWPGVEKGAQLLVADLLAGKRLVVWGDYDVDGITATTLVLQVLEAHGFYPGWHLPGRKEEGYGLNIEKIEALAAEGYHTLLTVDCGISDNEAIARAVELGMNVVVSDHHTPPEVLPPAHVLCNPCLGQCPCNTLAGVGVAFYLMAAVNSALAPITGKKVLMRQTLDLVALGSLADMVPLEGINRILVKHGLDTLAKPHRPGIAELKVVSGYKASAELGAGQVVFSLAPRINAAGRMAHANTALDLLRSKDHEEASRIAAKLDAYNNQRREEEDTTVREAKLQAVEYTSTPSLLLQSDNWNQGIIGIVASRMVEQFHKPTLILCKDGENYKGSGRSIKGFDLYSALEQCSNLLLGFGGHRMAAGLRVLPENVEALRQKFAQIVHAQYGNTQPKPIINLDAHLDFAQASNFAFLKELEMLQPFGIGNAEPVFASPPLVLRKRKFFGNGRNHVNLELHDASCGMSLHAKAWNQAHIFTAELEGKELYLAYSLGIDRYNGMATVDVKIKDFQLVEACVPPPWEED